jgi:hypothetical protein
LSFIPLLRPFVFQGALIPILPHSLEECLDAPVPFIIGLPKLPEKHDLDGKTIKKSRAGTVIYSLDDVNVLLVHTFFISYVFSLVFVDNRIKFVCRMKVWTQFLDKVIWNKL